MKYNVRLLLGAVGGYSLLLQSLIFLLNSFKLLGYICFLFFLKINKCQAHMVYSLTHQP